jgi:hypothetical protein
MTERPEPGWEAPEGFGRVAVVNEGWRLVTGKRCRQFVVGHRACGRPSVAEINRGAYLRGRGRVDRFWAYCADHLYGNWIEDGQVMHWILRRLLDATGD